MNTQNVSDFLPEGQNNRIEASLPRGSEKGGVLVRTEFRMSRPMLVVLTAVAFITVAPAPAEAADRDPRIAECEAEWGNIAIKAQEEGDEKKVANATKEKLACAEGIEAINWAEKILTDTMYRATYKTKLETDSQKIISYLKGESSISTQEMQQILTEYEHTVDKLSKYLDLNRPEDKETLLFHKKFIEQARKKIG